jgi:hypothetical protein
MKFVIDSAKDIRNAIAHPAPFTLDPFDSINPNSDRSMSRPYSWVMSVKAI